MIRELILHSFLFGLWLFSAWNGLGSPFQPVAPWHPQTGIGIGLFRGSPFSAPERALNSVTYGNGMFIAVGEDYLILKSKDGCNWTNRSDTLTEKVVGINLPSDLVYAFGGDSVTYATVSRPADKYVSASRPSAAFNSVFFENGIFVAVANSGDIAVSSNGDSWRFVKSPTQLPLMGIAWGKGKFVAVGRYGCVLTSEDAVHWVAVDSGTYSLLAVAFGNGVFVAVGVGGIFTSTDGLHWVPTPQDYGCGFDSITFGDGKFMVGAVEGYGLTMTSSDGSNWKEIVGPPSGLHSLAFGDGRFLALTHHIEPVVSNDGKTWQSINLQIGMGGELRQAAYGKGLFVAVGKNKILISSDAATWQPAGLPPQRMICGNLSHLSQNVMFAPYTAFFPPTVFPIPMILKDDRTWVSGSGIPFSVYAKSGNISGNRLIVDTGGRDEFAAFSSDDGITWKRLAPVSLATPEKNLSNTNAIYASVDEAALLSSNVAIGFDLNGHRYNLTFSTKIGEIYKLQASTDLEEWIDLTTLTNNGAAFDFVDKDAAQFPHRFYRLKLEE